MDIENIMISKICQSQKVQILYDSTYRGTKSSQIYRVEWWLPGPEEHLGVEKGIIVWWIQNFRFAIQRALEVGWATVWKYLTLLNYILKNGYDVSFMYVYFTIIEIFFEILKIKHKKDELYI